MGSELALCRATRAGRTRADDQLLARACAGEIAGGSESGGRLHQPRQHGRLPHGEIAGRPIEIMPRGRAHPVHIVAEIDVRQIAREDLVLAQPGFEPEGDDHLAQLARRGAIGIEEGVLGELLGDRAATLTHAAGPQIIPCRPRDPARINAPMGAEAPILDREDGIDDMVRQLGRIDRRADDRAAFCDGRPLGGQQRDAGRHRGLERLRQRRSEREIGDQQKEQGKASDEPPLHPAPADRGKPTTLAVFTVVAGRLLGPGRADSGRCHIVHRVRRIG